MSTLERDVLILQVPGLVLLLVVIGWVPVTTALAAAGICLTVGGVVAVARSRGSTHGSADDGR